MRLAGRLPRERRAPGARRRGRARRFDADDELPETLDRLVAELDGFRAAISVPSISSVGDRYLEVLGLGPAGEA